MHLDLLVAEPFQVLLHLFTVVPAFFLGTWLIFCSAKGGRWHRLLGHLYMTLMVVTALAALFVQRLHPGQWSWIHVLVPVTLAAVARAYWAARVGNVRAHRNAMVGLYVGGLVLAGVLTFMPGRLMFRMFVAP